MKILDLFCGAGGFSLGFKRVFPDAEFVGVDNWDPACRCYNKNIGEILNLNLIHVEPDDLPDADIIIGSPPCQEFSAANPSRSWGTSHIKKFFEIVDAKKPARWVMENVPGVSKILEDFYQGKAQIIKACDHGRPHLRRRLFVGPILDIIPTRPVEKIFPTPLATEWNAPSGPYSLSAMFNRKRTPFKVVKWLMGFPKKFSFPGNLREKYTLVGNAVVVNVAEAVARQGGFDHEM